ncbi:Mur ligase family protein [Microaceticoccus formicicus]|uniref:Mur ligase family protein n=1 Tax=Microaceticoccus formicicus TaxID=3118105 RepID=UPI003CCFFC7B|nr:Mur ligase family protein [Peptoniphilaceae bacterium AMB_02]
MNIKNLLNGVEILTEYNTNDNLEITNVNYNSKLIKPGGLFVAIEGLQTDGHKYIDNAIENGAIAVVVTKDIDNLNIPVYKTPNNRKSLAIISGNLYDHPSKDMTLIGITASNGKTSTSMMLKSILETSEVESGLIGTVMYKIRDKEIPSKLTTPESLELQGLFKEILDAGIETTVMEVSSISQEMYRVHGTEFDVVCMNNITREHIDQHGTFESYFEQKKKLITECKEDAFVILNLEDAHVKSLIDECPGKVITFSDVDDTADVYAKDIDISTGFGKYTLVVSRDFETKKGRAAKGEYPVELKVAGYHSVVNSISAISMAIALGLDMDLIIKGIESYYGIERRFQLIYDDEYMIVDDHFANMGNIAMTLQTLSMMSYNKAHMLYAIRGNRGVTVNGENVDTIIEWSDRVKFDTFIATKSVEIVEDHDVVSEGEEAIFKEKMDVAKIPYELYQELTPAIDKVLDLVEEGDLILLAGCQGMDFGAKIALENISRRHPEKDKEKLFDVLKDRVAGV